MVTIRPATHSDLDRLLKLLHLLCSIEEDFNFNDTKQRQGLTTMLSITSAQVLVAEVDCKVVGMCTGQLLISTAEGGPAVTVEDVVVLPEFQNRGVGKALLDEITSWGKKNKATRLQLLADKNNRHALKIYRKLGWHCTDFICLRKYI